MVRYKVGNVAILLLFRPSLLSNYLIITNEMLQNVCST